MQGRVVGEALQNLDAVAPGISPTCITVGGYYCSDSYSFNELARDQGWSLAENLTPRRT